MRRFLMLFTMLIFSGILTFAQNRVVSGKVTDEQGNPIPGATVTELGSTNATQADANGNFTIRVGNNARLAITSVGHRSSTVTVTGNTVAVTLTRGEELMQEVVVTTALGVRRQPKELGYATAKVSNKEITGATPVNLQQGLTGKVSGLNVQTTNNSVFQDTRITLRGIRSLTGNNQPMLVVDGSPMPLSQLNRINPNDIEDVTILKGSNAAALYGPEGVNGVIFVKTIRGSKTGSPVIRISNATQFERVQFLPKFQTQFGQGSSVDPGTGIGQFDPFENQQYGDPYDGSIRDIGRPLENGTVQTQVYKYNPKGRLNFFETGVTLQNDISYSSKNFVLSAQDANIKGTLPGDRNRRTTMRFVAGNEYGRFTSNFNVSYTRTKYDVAGVSPYWEVFNTVGSVDLSQYKNWRDPASAASPNHYFNEYYQNPYFITDRSRNKGQRDDLFAQAELGFKPLSWVSMTLRGSTNLRTNDFENTSEAFTFSNYAHNVTHKYNASSDIKASVGSGNDKFNRLSQVFYINAKRDITKDFSLDVLVGESFNQDVARNIAVSGSNLIIPTLFNVSNRTGEPGAGQTNYKVRTMGVYGKVEIGFQKWAFLEVAGRNDWDSRLPINNNSFFYPAASLSLILSDALPAIKSNDIISYLKLRGSISKSGNVNLGTAFGGAYQLEQTYNVAGGFPYGNLPGFTGSSNVNNPDIKPEFVNSKEAGIEISFLKNRINLEVTGYLQQNTNQILNVQVSRATGLTSALVNAADFDNKGLEFDLRLTPVINLGDFRFNFKGNFSLMDSKVKSVYQGLNEIGVGSGNYAIVGYPAFMFKLTDYARDPQGRIIVNSTTGYPTLDPNLKMFGQTLPKYMIGLNPSFAWKGLTLAATFDYRGGHQVYHGIGPDMDFTGNSLRSGRNNRQRFVVPNSVYLDGSGKYVENTDILTANGGYGFYEATATNRGVNSNYLTSAAAWKLREASLGYELPQSLLRSTKFIKGVTLSLTGRNIFTWLPESNEWTDPEFSQSTGNDQGVNNTNILPPNRLYGFNVVLTF
ncbi:MAG TPA: SusC/RagA family TonB-linked outer membrane protein [Chitinophagaceae bacterium]|nr:SusC/RagA family TonB-linked outer membrane protein [Chitinophagaceae bacterium]